MLTKEKYEEIINNTILFDLDRNDSKYNTEKNRLCNFIAEYYQFYIYKKEFQSIGYEYMLTFNNCVDKYNKEEGDFLNYIGRALKNNVERSRAKEEIANSRGGISIPDNKQRLAHKILKFAQSHNMDINILENQQIYFIV